MLAIYSKLLLSLFFFTGLHPLHVSTTEMNFNAKEKSIEISCRIFTDDFERILAKNYKTKTDLSKAELHKAMDVLIKKYVETNLKIVLNGQPAKLSYVGFEIDQEATNVYLEIEKVSAIQSLSVTNSLLYDLFDDQMNILHVENKGVRKSARNNYPATKLEVKFM